MNERSHIDLSRRVAEAQGWIVGSTWPEDEWKWKADGINISVGAYTPSTNIAQAMAFAREICKARGWTFELLWNEWEGEHWSCCLYEAEEQDLIREAIVKDSDMSSEKAAECICEAVLEALEK